MRQCSCTSVHPKGERKINKIKRHFHRKQLWREPYKAGEVSSDGWVFNPKAEVINRPAGRAQIRHARIQSADASRRHEVRPNILGKSWKERKENLGIPHPKNGDAIALWWSISALSTPHVQFRGGGNIINSDFSPSTNCSRYFFSTLPWPSIASAFGRRSWWPFWDELLFLKKDKYCLEERQ